MSWSRRGLIVGALAAAGCGFSPALAPDGAAGDLWGSFAFAAPETDLGFALTRRLEERLGLPAGPEYELRLGVAQGAQVTAIPANRVTSRVTLLGQVDFQVVEMGTDEVVHSSRVHNFTAYSSTSSTAATRAARVDAEKRLMTILADMLVADLLATAESWAA